MITCIKNNFIFYSMLFISIFLVACGNEQQSTSNVNKSEPKEIAEERVLIDSLGNEVTIPEKPERVIAPYLEDHLVALGITPVAQWSVNDGASIQTYLQDSLKDIPTIPFDLPFEAVTSFNPDLILIGSPETVEGGKYEQYNKIAPTYVLGNEEKNWRDKLLKIGEIFGQTDKANEVLKEYDQQVKEAKEKIKSTVGKQSAAAIWITNGSIFMVSETASSGSVLYGDLGLQAPNLVKEVSESATSDWSSVSLEKLAELDADYLFLINSDKGNGSEMLKDPLWANIPAVKNGNVFEFDQNTSWLYTGAIANSQIINEVVKCITK
ncbi:iron-hydroxamate ABC transporter substrate-binding protein [Pueribacillus theae]|uniref:iron-hydroxamate ABC transporter substrate-binding protein n=1 Tax=Pueribacillus theae TaxID=2171751 RepID=UPI001F0BE27C|nr:iron-hydroxamate ABC transporter substrate-binding protein [Pueribacillus theae]